MKKIYYLDHCGTTPPYPEVKQKLCEIYQSDLFGNPAASHHIIGSDAETAVEKARLAIASEFDVTASEVIFCGSATEANNIVIQGFARQYAKRRARIFYNPIEHKAVKLPCDWLASEVLEVFKIPLSSEGLLDLEWLEENLKKESGIPTLVCVMAVHNELPIKFPIFKIEKICAEHSAFFHCDATQWVVREKVSVSSTAISSFCFSGHKIYGPKGIGVLILNKKNKIKLIPLLFGGDQEFGMRPGTLNVPAILGLAVALEVTAVKRQILNNHLAMCDKIFCFYLEKHCSNLFCKTIQQSSVPGILNFYFKNINAMTLMIDLPHVCLNRGASCLGSGGEKVSHVPTELGLPVEVAANVLRASFGWGCTQDDVQQSAEIICRYVLKK